MHPPSWQLVQAQHLSPPSHSGIPTPPCLLIKHVQKCLERPWAPQQPGWTVEGSQAPATPLPFHLPAAARDVQLQGVHILPSWQHHPASNPGLPAIEAQLQDVLPHPAQQRCLDADAGTYASPESHLPSMVQLRHALHCCCQVQPCTGSVQPRRGDTQPCCQVGDGGGGLLPLELLHPAVVPPYCFGQQQLQGPTDKCHKHHLHPYLLPYPC